MTKRRVIVGCWKARGAAAAFCDDGRELAFGTSDAAAAAAGDDDGGDEESIVTGGKRRGCVELFSIARGEEQGFTPRLLSFVRFFGDLLGWRNRGERVGEFPALAVVHWECGRPRWGLVRPAF